MAYLVVSESRQAAQKFYQTGCRISSHHEWEAVLNGKWHYNKDGPGLK
jgi:hypothetical protein